MKLKTRTNQPVSGDLEFEAITDENNHKRFIEGDIDLIESPTGLTKTYGRWSLSGTHLLIVLACDIANATTITSGYYAYLKDLPQWIFNKIVPVFGTSNVERSSATLYADDYSNQSMGINLIKSASQINIQFANITTTADRKFRKSFDLLIDNA